MQSSLRVKLEDKELSSCATGGLDGKSVMLMKIISTATGLKKSLSTKLFTGALHGFRDEVDSKAEVEMFI